MPVSYDNSGLWAGIRRAAKLSGYSTVKIVSLALDGKVRYVQPADSRARLYSVADLEALRQQRHELLNA
jgi:hypothetical protein